MGNRVSGKSSPERKFTSMFLTMSTLVGLFPKEGRRRESRADLVVDHVPDESKEHRSDHSQRIEAQRNGR